VERLIEGRAAAYGYRFNHEGTSENLALEVLSRCTKRVLGREQ